MTRNASKGDNILKRFFSKRTFESVLFNNESPVFDYAVDRYISSAKKKSYLDIVKEIYSYMGKRYRTEYYYKNELLNQLLFQRHDYKKTVALTELPIGKSKADFVMINGRGVVYEIKTELDNLERINTQLDDYYKAFSYVYVVTYKENVEKVIAIVPDKTGVIELTPQNALKTIRLARVDNSQLDHETIYKVLRKKEIDNILAANGMALPKVDQFQYYDSCYRLFRDIDILTVQKSMLKELKRRENKKNSDRSFSGPKELKFLLYFDNERKLDSINIQQRIMQAYGE